MHADNAVKTTMEGRQILALLRRLDTLGGRITHLRSELKRLPEEVSYWQGLLASRSEKFEALRGERDDSDKRRLQLEAKLESLEVKRERSRHNMDRVTSVEQQTALQHELESLATMLDNNETEALELLERIDELDALMIGAGTKVEHAEEELAERVAARDEQTPLLNAELEEKLAAADVLLEEVPRDEKRMFRYAHGQDGRQVLVPTKNGACGRCLVTVPAHFINESLSYKGFHACPQCYGILDPWTERDQRMDEED